PPGLPPIPTRRSSDLLSIPGMDQTKEAVPDPSNNIFIKRGMNVLAVDGPGQGTSNLRKLRVTADNHERATRACVDWLTKQPEVEDRKSTRLNSSHVKI